MEDKNSNQLLKIVSLFGDKLQDHFKCCKCFTLYEYQTDSGYLQSCTGSLLDDLGIKMPDRFSDLVENVRLWPVESKGFQSTVDYFQLISSSDILPENKGINICLKSGSGKKFISAISGNQTVDDKKITCILFFDSGIETGKNKQLSDETDELTGTLKKPAFKNSIEDIISNGRKHAFIILNLDGFKKFSESFGHVLGDNMLINVVNTLRNGLRKDDIIGRIGGDEFVICICNVSEIRIIERIAKHICSLTHNSLPNGMFLSASLGIALIPDDGNTFDELYKKASTAIHFAKRRGGDCFVIYNDSLENNSNATDADHNENAFVVPDRVARSYDKNIIIVYDCQNNSFKYQLPDSRPLWTIMIEDGIASEETANRLHAKINEISKADTASVYFTEYFMRDINQVWKWFRVGFVCSVPGTLICITFTDINEEIAVSRRLTQMTEYDELTGLFSRSAFCRTIESVMRGDTAGVAAGEYALIYFDVIRFKAVNDMYNMAEGDRLLIYIADAILKLIKASDTASRISADRFLIFTHTYGHELEMFIDKLFDLIAKYGLPFEVTCNAGIYVTTSEQISADAMIDRSILAQSSIKGSYTIRYTYYTESLRSDMLSEQEIVGAMAVAIAQKQFVLFYQPQYNHSTGLLIGAEALVRWIHPERGVISPGVFIPIFEKNGFITSLDLYVFEQACAFIRKCMDKGLPLVPISTNFSRHDIFQHNFVDKLEEFRSKYDVPVKYIRVEITESAIVGGSEYTNEVIRKLHSHGYIVEMDDFGSGYSSLNVLKDIELDIIKLDMQFLSEEKENNRGGTILSSIVRMANWLCMPVIAEGVETVNQADFLRSIGCDYIQGYLYSKPLPEDKYEELLSGSKIGASCPQMHIIASLNTCNFWDPKSLETLIFSNYVGGAAIFDYNDGKVEFLRVNKKYLQELSMNLSEKDIINTDLLESLDDNGRKMYTDMLQKAIDTLDEQECETWRKISSSCCGDDMICIRANVRIIAKNKNSSLFYAMIRNITSEKKNYRLLSESEKRFKMASEQVNVYCWEYIVATREMHPCFRCMRDLGLPAVVTNYPDTAIEMGIFPPEVADMYRDWHRQISQGVPELEAVIPLTVGRVPFRVKYTTEFDANGHPVKAYGSAALVV